MTHIEGSIQWNLVQIRHCVDWALDPNYYGFSKDAAFHTMSLYFDRINQQTKLAFDWDWEIEYFHFALDNFNPAQLVLAGSEWVEDYM